MSQVSYNAHLSVQWLSVTLLIGFDLRYDFTHLRLRIFQRLVGITDTRFCPLIHRGCMYDVRLNSPGEEYSKRLVVQAQQSNNSTSPNGNNVYPHHMIPILKRKGIPR